MDSSGIQVARPIGIATNAVGALVPERQTLSQTPLKSSKLPPISGRENHPSMALLQAANSELDHAMKHLLTEAQNTEKQMQRSVELLWQRMMEISEQRYHELEAQLNTAQEELVATKEKLTRTLSQEAALVQQNAKMSMELVSEEKKRKSLEITLTEVKGHLAAKGDELERVQKELKSYQETSEKKMDELHAEVKDKTKSLRDYQDKISKLTDKMKELSRQLTTEKEVADKQQKMNSEQTVQQTSENKKLALEMSKLKSQLNTSSSSLAAAKEEIKRLELELKSFKQVSEATLNTLQVQHCAVVRALEKKISDLENELATLTLQYQSEAASLSKELKETKARLSQLEDNDDEIDARIRFLQHQNREEKKKLESGKRMKT